MVGLDVWEWANVMSKSGPSSSSNVARAGKQVGVLDLRSPYKPTRPSSPQPLSLGPLMPKCPTTQ